MTCKWYKSMTSVEIETETESNSNHTVEEWFWLKRYRTTEAASFQVEPKGIRKQNCLFILLSTLICSHVWLSNCCSSQQLPLQALILCFLPHTSSSCHPRCHPHSSDFVTSTEQFLYRMDQKVVKRKKGFLIEITITWEWLDTMKHLFHTDFWH